MNPSRFGRVCGFLSICYATAAMAVDPELPKAHEPQKIEGWTVRVDRRLLEPAHEKLGVRALALLQNHLQRVRDAVAPQPLEKLQAVTIQLDLDHGSLKSMQYHPSAQWLEEHGFTRELAKCVHIPNAAGFAELMHQHTQPWCVLHELSHAYHHQVLGFDEIRIKSAWEKYKAGGHGDSVLRMDGRRQKHYALTNPQEFFAEMSEAYFGTNDFFPFVHGELKTAEPEIHALLREIWGPPAWSPSLKKDGD